MILKKADKMGELWNEPDGGGVVHLLPEGGESDDHEEEQPENFTETAYMHLWWGFH